MKKTYMTPTMMVVRINQYTPLLAGSVQSASVSGLEEDELIYDESGGDVINAW